MSQVVPSKQDIMGYVQHMEELETREFALRKAAEELREAKREIESDAAERLQLINRELNGVAEPMSAAEKYWLICRADSTEPYWDKNREWPAWDRCQDSRAEYVKRYIQNSPYYYIATPDQVKERMEENGLSLEKLPLDPPKQAALKKPKNYEESKDKYWLVAPAVGGYILGSIGIVFLHAVLWAGVGDALCIGQGMNQSIYGWILPVFIISAIIWIKKLFKRYKKKKGEFNAVCAANEYDKKCQEQAEIARSYEEIYLRMFYLHEAMKIEKIKSEQAVALAETKAQYLQAQAESLEKQADIIAANKIKLYQLSIVPPDYRTLDCVIMLNSIFKNDLADTMREAILLYDERVFRGEVLQGIQKIYDMLGKLASSMRAIESCLLDIRRDVADMTAEMRGIASEMHESRRYQEKAADEARATRYAMESVQRSTELLEWYERKKAW